MEFTTADLEVQHIIYEKDVAEHISRITLNRPDKMNALSFALFEELIKAIKDAENDDNIKVVIIRGAGSNFSAGHDLQEFGEQYGMRPGVRPPQISRIKPDRHTTWELYPQLFHSLKPTIAQVQGYCLEGGLYVSSLCDITIASEDAKFGFPGQRVGGDAGVSLVHLFYLMMGPKMTRELLLTGRIVDAAEALQLRLVNHVVPGDKLEDEVLRYAKAIALYPLDGIAFGKIMNYLAQDRLGLNSMFLDKFVTHAWFTNMHIEEGVFNFFKRRKEVGLSAAFAERREQFRKLGF